MTAPLRLEAGELAPDFTLPDQNGEPVTLSELRGSKVILYFYGEAGTPACTGQACDFRDRLGDFEREGYRVVGVSRDEQPANAKMARDEHLTFPVLSDPDARGARQVRHLRREAALRQDRARRDPRDLRARRGRPDHACRSTTSGPPATSRC